MDANITLKEVAQQLRELEPKGQVRLNISFVADRVHVVVTDNHLVSQAFGDDVVPAVDSAMADYRRMCDVHGVQDPRLL